MSSHLLEVNVAAWVEEAREDPVVYQQRQTIEIVLNTIARTIPLNTKMFLKGGLLMGLAYSSPRQTIDIDFTTILKPENDSDAKIREILDQGLPEVAAVLGYPDLVVQIHSVKRQPPKIPTQEAQFPALKLKVTSARRKSRQEVALNRGEPSNVIIEIDISFNEPSLQQIQILKLTNEHELLAYSLVDLIAEKYRAILQQIDRNRRRSQDIYDLSRLITHEVIDADTQALILIALKEKSRARGIDPKQGSLDDPEIKSRCKAGWESLKLEIVEVPEFETCFADSVDFYCNLPWENHV
ncbi:MAG: nucleotidyl transferase AbiEii/AbiGii toxin family protein [Bacteroidetes bacterium]|nr:nucleotidyl transferase AbiEii/AbiGii toxin family protein [Bacteroidota bacterium]